MRSHSGGHPGRSVTHILRVILVSALMYEGPQGLYSYLLHLDVSEYLTTNLTCFADRFFAPGSNRYP